MAARPVPAPEHQNAASPAEAVLSALLRHENGDAMAALVKAAKIIVALQHSTSAGFIRRDPRNLDTLERAS